MIRLENISRKYGLDQAATQALEGITLEIPKGSFALVVGTSGCGKTTLLNIIGGLDSQFEGRARVAGCDLSKLDDRQLSRFRSQTVGFVFQHFHLLDHLDALQNVMLGSFFSQSNQSAPGPQAAERAEEVLCRVGLGEKLNQLPGQLSGGQKQRVAIARALFAGPDLILADEPTGNLDTHTGTQIINLFEKLSTEDGLTVVVVTHEENLFQNATVIIRLEDGRLTRGSRL